MKKFLKLLGLALVCLAFLFGCAEIQPMNQKSSAIVPVKSIWKYSLDQGRYYYSMTEGKYADGRVTATVTIICRESSDIWPSCRDSIATDADGDGQFEKLSVWVGEKEHSFYGSPVPNFSGPSPVSISELQTILGHAQEARRQIPKKGKVVESFKS